MDAFKALSHSPETLPNLTFTEHVNDQLFKAGNDGGVVPQSTGLATNESELRKLGFPAGPELIFPV